MPSGQFSYGVHRPHFDCHTYRTRTDPSILGRTREGRPVDNRRNYPTGELKHLIGDCVFEIPNAFPFRGTTFINRRWADAQAQAPQSIRLPDRPGYSLTDILAAHLPAGDDQPARIKAVFASLPEAVCLAVATTSEDPRDLVELAHLSCSFAQNDETGVPDGLIFESRDSDAPQPAIGRPELYEAVANNPNLPDTYKRIMVLRPGVQGGSPIVGESGVPGENHVWEYLRHNSYIPWGHFAANMAHDCVRYRLADLTLEDVTAMRHLYYQRSYTRMARGIGMAIKKPYREWPIDDLERLRIAIRESCPFHGGKEAPYRASLWGWNFGFDFAPSFNRLHASHQQIHQQYALIPNAWSTVPGDPETAVPYGFGDLIAEFADRYRQETGRDFFACYLKAIANNRRMDDDSQAPQTLVVYEDARVILFVPKAQTSQWELQLMVKKASGNILETDSATRSAVDHAIWIALRCLDRLGARMISSIEMSSGFDQPPNRTHLMYAFLPRLPESPGAFSEAQLRWINGHYPEDFAMACRSAMAGENPDGLNAKEA